MNEKISVDEFLELFDATSMLIRGRNGMLRLSDTQVFANVFDTELLLCGERNDEEEIEMEMDANDLLDVLTDSVMVACSSGVMMFTPTADHREITILLPHPVHQEAWPLHTPNALHEALSKLPVAPLDELRKRTTAKFQGH